MMKVKRMFEDDLIHLRVDVFFYNIFIENDIELKNICKDYFCFGIFDGNRILGVALFNKDKMIKIKLRALFVKEQNEDNKLAWNLLKHAEAFLTTQSSMIVY